MKKIKAYYAISELFDGENKLYKVDLNCEDDVDSEEAVVKFIMKDYFDDEDALYESAFFKDSNGNPSFTFKELREYAWAVDSSISNILVEVTFDFL